MERIFKKLKVKEWKPGIKLTHEEWLDGMIHDCKLREKGFCKCTDADINLGLNAKEQAQALKTIEQENELCINGECKHINKPK
jgi:hypothetical protein